MPRYQVQKLKNKERAKKQRLQSLMYKCMTKISLNHFAILTVFLCLLSGYYKKCG